MGLRDHSVERLCERLSVEIGLFEGTALGAFYEKLHSLLMRQEARIRYAEEQRSVAQTRAEHALAQAERACENAKVLLSGGHELCDWLAEANAELAAVKQPLIPPASVGRLCA